MFLCAMVSLPAAKAFEPAASLMRDGSHDMDFATGTWRADIVRYLHPFLDSAQTTKLAGKITVQSIWNGKAEVEQIEVPTANGIWEAASLYLYDPVGHQWSRSYANSEVGHVDASPKVGDFRDGKLAFYSLDTFEGRSILVREIFYGITRNSHDYQEDYSADGGRIWHAAFKAHMTRIPR